MAPTPETAGPIVRMSNEDADDSGSNNQYTNKAFVKDEPLDSAPPTTTSAQQSIAENVPNLDFDDILPHIGEFGTYQKILFFLMIPFAFFVAFVYFSQIFITLVPEKHWCRIYELEHLPIEQRLVVCVCVCVPQPMQIALS